jgi:hypothetical protein
MEYKTVTAKIFKYSKSLIISILKVLAGYFDFLFKPEQCNFSMPSTLLMACGGLKKRKPECSEIDPGRGNRNDISGETSSVLTLCDPLFALNSYEVGKQVR